MYIASSTMLGLRLVPLLVLTTCASGSKVSSATGRRQLRGGVIDPGYAPAAAPIPESINGETPPDLLKDIPEPPPPPAQPPPEPPIPPLPPDEGQLVHHPPRLPSELSIYPEAATSGVISEEMDVTHVTDASDSLAGSAVGAMVVDSGVVASTTSHDSAAGTMVWGGQDGDHLVPAVVFNTETPHHPPITPPHAPMHAPDVPPEPPNTTTTTVSHTLFPVAVNVDPDCAEEVQKALAAAAAASPCASTTTTMPKTCASYCNGVCVEEKSRELGDGALETVTAQGPCYEKAAAATSTPTPVKTTPVLEPPPPLPDAVQYVGLQRA